jgi:hypothetical protein
MKSNKISTVSLSLVASAVVSALALPAQAAENRAQRYTPGLGGTDMTTMLVPGWYGQVAMIHYHATKLKDQNGDSPVLTSGSVPGSTVAAAAADATQKNVYASVFQLSGNAALAQAQSQGAAAAVNAALAGNGLQYKTTINSFRADAYIALPRLTYISGEEFLGAHVGFTTMLPIVRRQTSLAGVTTFTDQSAAINAAVTQTTGSAALGAGVASGVTSGIQSSVNSKVNSQLAAKNGSAGAWGDLEFAPVLNWEIGDHQTATFTPTLIVPTGKYDKNAATNSGFGKFYTFRPSFQYGFIGDGWDVGARMVLSFNTKNKDTNYKSGTMFNVDFAAMKFVTEDLRVGLQGYVVNQLTKDSSDDATVQAAIDAADGAKMRAYAAGPALGWIVNGGEMVVEGKLLKEFGARNRSEGTTYMLMLSKPFGL